MVGGKNILKPKMMLESIIKAIANSNISAGLTGLTVSFGGTILQVNNIITDIDGIMGLVVDLFLAVVYISTAVWLLTQTVNLRDTIIQRRKEIKQNTKTKQDEKY